MLDIREIMLRSTIPVIINVFNQLAYLEQMINSFEAKGFKSIVVIDQASEYAPLNRYLADLVAQRRAAVVKLPENYGPHWFYASRLFESVPSPFIYTDPDIAIPDNLSEAFCHTLYEATKTYQVAKAGCALDISEPELLSKKRWTTAGRDWSILEWERQFWSEQVDENVYKADIDTTLHLFNKDFYDPRKFYNAVRFSGPGFLAKHLPWYVQGIVPEEEAAFYAQRTRHSSWV